MREVLPVVVVGGDYAGDGGLVGWGQVRVVVAEVVVETGDLLVPDPDRLGETEARPGRQPGLVAEGRSLTEAVSIAQDLARKIASENAIALYKLKELKRESVTIPQP